MYNYDKESKAIRIYMEALEIHTGTPIVHCEDSTSCISVVEPQIATHRVKHVDIPVCFIQEIFDNVLFVPKY